LADWVIQTARHDGRLVSVGDGDRRNPTLAGLYPPCVPGGATQPETDETADVKDWITKALGNMVANRSSLVLDLGGGDRVLAEYGRDLGLVDFCEAARLRGSSPWRYSSAGRTWPCRNLRAKSADLKNL